jgi:tRNA U34 2-thiouridine synthase MnmA/TrmU
VIVKGRFIDKGHLLLGYLSNEVALYDIATQKESSEICFVENEYTEILQRHMDIDLPGEVVDTSGNVVGTHKGYMHYTIGKRRGFFVNGAHDHLQSTELLNAQPVPRVTHNQRAIGIEQQSNDSQKKQSHPRTDAQPLWRSTQSH